MAQMNLTVAATGDPEFDELVQTNSLALLLAMLLDQQISIELAFRGPARLQSRLGTSLTVENLVRVPEERLIEMFGEKPALHRFPKNMAKRAHELFRFLDDEVAGDVDRLWNDGPTAEVLFRRLLNLPGFGDEKAMILLAVLGKRSDIAPSNWQKFAGPFADNEPRSVADIDSPAALARVKDWKKAQRAAGRTKQQ